jgi:hypothetical protein
LGGRAFIDIGSCGWCCALIYIYTVYIYIYTVEG